MRFKFTARDSLWLTETMTEETLGMNLGEAYGRNDLFVES